MQIGRQPSKICCSFSLTRIFFFNRIQCHFRNLSFLLFASVVCCHVVNQTDTVEPYISSEFSRHQGTHQQLQPKLTRNFGRAAPPRTSGDRTQRISTPRALVQSPNSAPVARPRAAEYPHDLPAPLWSRKDSPSSHQPCLRDEPLCQSLSVPATAVDARKTNTGPLRRSLYRRSLKLSLDWAVQRHIWRGQAAYIRSLFEANRGIEDPRQQRVR